MVLKGFPNVITWPKGQKYTIGEKSTIILYTDINHLVGTPKQNQRTLPGMGLEVQNIWTKSSRLLQHYSGMV